jgi:hypothetical protein
MALQSKYGRHRKREGRIEGKIERDVSQRKGSSKGLRRELDHSRLDVLLILDDILCDLEPELLPQSFVLDRRLVRAAHRQLDVSLLQRQIDAALPQPHLAVDVRARSDPRVRHAETEGVVEVIVRTLCSGVGGSGGQEGEEGGVGGRSVGCDRRRGR